MTSTGAGEQVAVLAAAAAGLHEDLSAGSAWRLGEDELLRVTGSLVRLRSSVEAVYLRAVAEVDRRRSAGLLCARSVDGPRGSGSGIGSSTESCLRTSTPLTPGQARSDVAAARALGPAGSLRELEPALAAGDVTRAHVDVATRCLDRIPVHLRSKDEDRAPIANYFATLAPTRHPLNLKHAATALLERLAPEVLQRFDPHNYERRFLDLTTDTTGMLLGHFALDPAAGATLRAAVDAAAAPAPSTDGVRDDRTARQRRADALVLIADTASGVSGPVRGERPRVVVHTSAEQARGRAGRPGRVRRRSGWLAATQAPGCTRTRCGGWHATRCCNGWCGTATAGRWARCRWTWDAQHGWPTCTCAVRWPSGPGAASSRLRRAAWALRRPPRRALGRRRRDLPGQHRAAVRFPSHRRPRRGLAGPDAGGREPRGHPTRTHRPATTTPSRPPPRPRRPCRHHVPPPAATPGCACRNGQRR